MTTTLTRLTTDQLVETAHGLIRDYGLDYATTHKNWLVSTGVHPEYADTIINIASEEVEALMYAAVDATEII